MQKDKEIPHVNPEDLKEDYRTVGKASRLSEPHQIADDHVRSLGIICSMQKIDEDHYILGSYNQIGRWNRKTKEVKVEHCELGGIWGYKEVDGYQIVVPDSFNACVAKDGKSVYNFGNSIKGTYVKGHHNMGRNIHFSDKYLYFVTKKLHRLVQINIHEVIAKAQAGEVPAKDHEEGKVLAFSVADFDVAEDGTVTVILEDTSVEIVGNESVSRVNLT